jgi:hypothetical protein
LSRLLDVAFRNGLANAPLCAQSAELLQRMSACAQDGSEQ